VPEPTPETQEHEPVAFIAGPVDDRPAAAVGRRADRTDPDHDEHASMKTWVGKEFDPENFDLAAVNRALQKIGNRSGRRSRAGASRITSLH